MPVTRSSWTIRADAAVERRASKTRLKAALRAAGLKVAPAEREVLDAVRAQGGAARPKTTRIVEVDA